MKFVQSIPRWLGITTPRWMHAAIARRNMPVLAVVSATTAMFAIMLMYYLFTGQPCPIDGFDSVAYRTPGTTSMYKIAITGAAVVMTAVCVFAIVYFWRKWDRPGIATAVMIAFMLTFAVLWVAAEAGGSAERQAIFFSSLQFLLAALLVVDPLVSLVYFAAAFAFFGGTLAFTDQLTASMTRDLIYLACIDFAVCTVVYGLFVRAQERERDVSTQAHRDELTGAKNRHCLRDDFPTYLSEDIFVMLCDIDDFKYYNDNFDHSVGDDLLRQFYFALREAFGDECVYRYGGDEFLVVSVEFGSEEFRRKAQKVRSQIAVSAVGEEEVGLTYSGGCVRGAASDNEAFRDMLHQADENLLEAKRNGKNQVVGI